MGSEVKCHECKWGTQIARYQDYTSGSAGDQPNAEVINMVPNL